MEDMVICSSVISSSSVKGQARDMTIVMRGSPAGGDSQPDPNTPQQQQQQQPPAQTGQQPPTTQAPTTTSATTPPITTQPQQSQENPPLAGQPTNPPGTLTTVEQAVDPAPTNPVNTVPVEEGGQGDGVDATVQVSALNKIFALQL